MCKKYVVNMSEMTEPVIQVFQGVNKEWRIEFYGGPSLRGEDHNVVLGQKFPSKTEAIVASSNPSIELMASRWFEAIKNLEKLEKAIWNYNSNV